MEKQTIARPKRDLVRYRTNGQLAGTVFLRAG
ncbi:hypothetical protein J2X72_004736 [Phyllobacterium sp. 1468]|nr:hypothetical protein [Phyllobacterium sp. 1468]